MSQTVVKTFIVWSDQLVGRIDAFYYQPEFTNAFPKNQKLVKLGQIISDISGGATPKVTGDFYTDSKDGVPFLRVQNITEDGILLDDAKYIKKEVHNGELKRSKLRANDIVFTITGRIGSVAVVPKDFEGNINQHSVRFCLKKDCGILPDYLAIFFNSEQGRKLSFRNTTGGTRPALDYVALKNLEIPLISIREQEKIINDHIKSQEERTIREAEAQEIIDSINDYVLSELSIKIPEVKKVMAFTVRSDEIERKRIDPSASQPHIIEINKMIRDLVIRSKSLREVADFENSVVFELSESAPYVGLENIESDTGNYIPGLQDKESVSSAFQFKKGNILFPKLRPYLNKVHYCDFDGICSTEFHVMVAKKCDPYYLYLFLQNKLTVMQTSSLMTGNTLPRLQTKDIGDLLIPLPDLNTQRKIVDEVKSRQEKARKLINEA